MILLTNDLKLKGSAWAAERDVTFQQQQSNTAIHVEPNVALYYAADAIKM